MVTMRVPAWLGGASDPFRSGRQPDVGPLSWRVMTGDDALDVFAPEWSSLLRRSASNEPTLAPEWLMTWWKVFGPLDGRKLRFGLLHDGTHLLAIAPLLTRRHWYRPGVPFRRLELMASGEDEADEIC